MKKLFIVANWKSNLTSSQANEWFERFTIYDLRFTNKEIVICPPFTLLPLLKSSIIHHKSSVKLGAQNISPFDKGAYTGEINAQQIREFADYALIGHSERRQKLFENEKMLEDKVKMARQYNLEPVFFIQDKQTVIPTRLRMVAFEPPSSISPGPADTPENAEQAAVIVKKQKNIPYVFYGGNVTASNVKGFTSMPHIDGVVVGRASLDPQEFSQIIQNA